MFGKNKEAFGHNGFGGSLGFADPIEGIGIAYITRKINSSMKADIRAVSLIKKFYEILDYTNWSIFSKTQSTSILFIAKELCPIFSKFLGIIGTINLLYSA